MVYIGENNMFNSMFNMIDISSNSMLEDFDSTESLFDSMFNSFNIPKTMTYPINIYEYNNRLEFEIAAIGKSIDDIEVSVEDSNLHIKTKDENVSSEKTKEELDESPKCIFNKLKKTKFNFIYQLGGQYEIDKISAKMNNGLLVVSIPKKEKSVKKIVINTEN